MLTASLLRVASSLDRNPASASSVGWSYRIVGSRSIARRAASVLVNSTADKESKPDDMSGAFISILVPVISTVTAWTVLWTSSEAERAVDKVEACCARRWDLSFKLIGS